MARTGQEALGPASPWNVIFQSKRGAFLPGCSRTSLDPITKKKKKSYLKGIIKNNF